MINKKKEFVYADTDCKGRKKNLLSDIEAMRLRYILEAVLHPDAHNGPAGYRIRSLYFDTPEGTDYFEKQDGLESRKKVRLRIYNPVASTAKLELKQKTGSAQRKRSLILSRDDALAMCQGNYSCLMHNQESFGAEMYGLMMTRCYCPSVIVDYHRRAYTTYDGKVRITFDDTISSTRANFNLFDPHLLTCPASDIHATVLEVKYSGVLPQYVKDTLNGVQKSEISVSKYVLALQAQYFE